MNNLTVNFSVTNRVTTTASFHPTPKNVPYTDVFPKMMMHAMIRLIILTLQLSNECNYMYLFISHNIKTTTVAYWSCFSKGHEIETLCLVFNGIWKLDVFVWFLNGVYQIMSDNHCKLNALGIWYLDDFRSWVSSIWFSPTYILVCFLHFSFKNNIVQMSLLILDQVIIQ